MKKLFSIISISLIALLFVISCSNQTPTLGTSPETKKQMTQSEYASNKAAINALNVVEAYGMNVATPSARSLSTSKEYKFDKEVDINTTALKEKLNSIEDPILKQMISNLPNDFTVKIKQGSYFSYTISEEGIFTYHTIDLIINVNGKEIEIEKDFDDKWIEIDGSFFDLTHLEEMLELADDAADVIDDLFINLLFLRVIFTFCCSFSKLIPMSKTQLLVILLSSTVQFSNIKWVFTFFESLWAAFE